MLTKFAKLDRLILILATLTALGLLILLLNENLLIPNSENSSEPLLGVVEEFHSDARKKNSNSFVWRNLHKGMQVHEQDSLFTGANSQMTIAFSEGSKLQLEENSLVTLKQETGQVLLDLKFGRMTGEISKSAPLTVRVNGQDFELKNDSSGKTKVEIERTPTGKLEAKSSNGVVQFKSKAKPKEKIVLQGDSKASVSQDGAIKEKPAPKLIVKSAPASPWLTGDGSQPLKFEWAGKNLSEYQLKISPTDANANLKNIFERTFEEHLSFDKIPAGTYTWSLGGIDDTGKVTIKTEPKLLTVTNLLAPKFKNWEAQRTFELKSNKAGLNASIPVQWEPQDPLTSKYQIQVSSSEDFSKPILDKSLTTQAVTTPNLPSGKYFFRLRAESKSGIKSNWELADLNLNLVEHIPIQPNAPRLVRQKVIVDLKNKNRSPSQVPAANLKWLMSNNYKVENFVVEVSDSKEFVNPEKFEIKSFDLLYSKINRTKKYFRVQAIGEENTHSPYSSVGEIIADIGNPILNKIEDKIIRADGPHDSPPVVNFKANWSEVPLTDHYQLQVSAKADFSEVTTYEVSSTSHNIEIKSPGIYHARVRSIASDASAISDFSNLEKFTYEHNLPLEAPRLKDPLNKATVFLQKDGAPFVWLEWTSLDRAQTYIVEVASDPDFKHILSRQQTKEYRYLVKDKVPSETVYWRVKAFNERKKLESNWTSPRFFNLFQKSNNRFVE